MQIHELYLQRPGHRNTIVNYSGSLNYEKLAEAIQDCPDDRLAPFKVLLADPRLKVYRRMDTVFEWVLESEYAVLLRIRGYSLIQMANPSWAHVRENWILKVQ